MKISQYQLHNQLVLTLNGRFDGPARKSIQEAVEKARTHHRHLVVNLSEVPFMDSSAIGFLVLTHERLKQEDGQLTLVCPIGYVRNLLDLANIGNMIQIVATEQEIGEAVAGMS